MFTKPQEVVIFPWLPDKTMLAIADKLNRKIIAGDLNLQRCREAISYSRLSIEPLA
jgi:DNA modification methylase